MQSRLLNINEKGDQFPKIKSNLSFQPFLNFLEKKLESGDATQREYIQNIIHHFEIDRQSEPLMDIIDPSPIEDKFKLIYSALTPP